MKKRRIKRILRNGFLWMSVILAIAIFITSAMFLIEYDFIRTIALLISAVYIMTFIWVNEVE